jgi:hypothetical protein
MKSRIAIMISAGVLAISPAMHAQQAQSGSFSYTSAPGRASAAAQVGKQATIQGQRNILELMADHLELSSSQKLQLRSLLDHQQEQVSALHQDIQLSDDGKREQFQEIKRQTREDFLAMLTAPQKREFSRMMHP